MRSLVAAEIQKLFTTRLWLWLLLASLGLTVLYVALTIGFADDPDTWTLPLSTSEAQRTLLAIGAGPAPLVAVLGVIGLSAEYRHRTVTDTFLATPHRGRVVLAKLLTYAMAGVAVGIICLVAVIAVAWPWLASREIDIVLSGTDVAAGVSGVLSAMALWGIVGVGLAALIREQVVIVVGLLIYLFLVENILTNVGPLDGVTKYLPGQANEAIAGSTLTKQDFLDPWQGGLVLAAYGLVFALGGTLLTVRRDVT